MRIHHLNAISTCPVGGRLMDGRSRSVWTRGELVCHCLLIETDYGLVLVDTGFGLQDVHSPGSRLSAFFLAMVKPDFREDMTAIRQIESLGFSPRDVRHIVMSHLDFDHAGGLDDFPWATVHMLRREHDDALAQGTWMDRQRFRPQQWQHRERWRTYNVDDGEGWFGFPRVQPLAISDDILLIPLPGHTHGHSGIAVRGTDGWQLLAADAYFHENEMRLIKPCCTPGLRFYQWMLEKDRRARLENQYRLRALKATHVAEISIFCSHDAAEFERITGRSPALPAGALRDRPIR
jgi:glyoxylase-like metal-dependent hydrolase (beta-lactamase superfamily II)